MAKWQVFCSFMMISINFVMSALYIDNVTTTINSSFSLYPNDRIRSRSKKTVLSFQDSDGNFVLYKINQSTGHTEPIFSSRTANQNAKEVKILSNGNMVIIDTSSNIIWETLTARSVQSRPFRLSVIDECMYLIDKKYEVYWSRGNCNCSHPSFVAPSPYPGDPTASPSPSPISLIPVHSAYVTIPTNASFILPYNTKIWSKSKDSALVMQRDGNLVLYHYSTCFNEKALWHTNTDGLRMDALYVEVQSNGNITIRDANGEVYWQSNTVGNIAMQPFRLGVAQDCVYLMDTNLTIFWEQGPGCIDVVILHPTFYPTEYPTKYPITQKPNASHTTNRGMVTEIATTMKVDGIHNKPQQQTDYLLMILLFSVGFLCVLVIMSLLCAIHERKAVKTVKGKEEINNNFNDSGIVKNREHHLDGEAAKHNTQNGNTQNVMISEHDDGEQMITEEGDGEQIITSGNEYNPNIAEDEFVVIDDDEQIDTHPTVGE
eukprot:129996_1